MPVLIRQTTKIVRTKAAKRRKTRKKTSNSDCEADKEPREKLNPIVAADDEMVPGNAKCLDCEEDLDVSGNERGDCRCKQTRTPTSDNEL